MDIKVEVKGDSCFLDICSESKKELFTKDIKKVKTETITSGSDCHMDIKTEIEETKVFNLQSQDQRELSSDDPVMECNKSDIDTKIEIKEEQWWLQTTSTESACNYDIKDEDSSPVTSSRLCAGVSGAGSDKAPLTAAEVLVRDTSFYSRKNNREYERQKSDLTEIPTEEHFLPEQSVKRKKQKTLINKGKRPHICKTCDKSFTWSSDLKRHYLIHESKKPHKCNTCDKSFMQLSDLKKHNLIHEGKKPHKCTTCDKSFTWSSDLKKHYLIHEGKKPHKCRSCDKSFTQLSHLKVHCLIHEGKKPHQCKTCDKSFARPSDLKKHNLIHEGKKSHKCKTCDSSFTQMSSLKRHYSVHESK